MLINHLPNIEQVGHMNLDGLDSAKWSIESYYPERRFLLSLGGGQRVYTQSGEELDSPFTFEVPDGLYEVAIYESGGVLLDVLIASEHPDAYALSYDERRAVLLEHVMPKAYKASLVGSYPPSNRLARSVFGMGGRVILKNREENYENSQWKEVSSCPAEQVRVVSGAKSAKDSSTVARGTSTRSRSVRTTPASTRSTSRRKSRTSKMSARAKRPTRSSKPSRKRARR